MGVGSWELVWDVVCKAGQGWQEARQWPEHAWSRGRGPRLAGVDSAHNPKCTCWPGWYADFVDSTKLSLKYSYDTSDCGRQAGGGKEGQLGC
jgi:hypothetical protein